MMSKAVKRMVEDMRRFVCGECDFVYTNERNAEACHRFVAGYRELASNEATAPCANCQREMLVDGRKVDDDFLCAGCWLHIKHGE